MRLPWDEVKALCAEARDVVLVAPYIKVPALQRILGMTASDAKILCVSRWTTNDILSGSTDIETRRVVIERGGDFRMHPRLHGKYYRFGKSVLIGSANITETGLGFGGQGNYEILCGPNSSFSVDLFESGLIAGSREIGDAEFIRWKEVDALKDTHPLVSIASEDMTVGDWRPMSREPEHVWLAYTERAHLIITPDQRELARRDVSSIGIPQGLDEQTFKVWVRSSLLASSFVSSVIGTEAEDHDTARQEIARQWRLEERDAARAIGTCKSWLRWFDL